MILSKKNIVDNLPSAVQVLAAALSGGNRVLLVDDDSSLWEIVRHIPESMLCNVQMVGTAGEAKALMQMENKVPFSFAIVDVGITNGDGIALYAWIKENFPALQTYFLTGFPKEYVEKRIREVGSAPILTKDSSIYSMAFWQDLFSTYFKIGWRKAQPQQ